MRSQATRCLRRGKVGAAVLLRWTRRHTLLAAVALLVTAIIAPRQVQGQLPSPCCAILATGLGTINSSLINVVGGGLQAINTVMTDIRNFEQTVIWPQQAIARALGLAGQIQGFYAQIRAVFQVPIASATLANPKQLENVLLSRNAGQIPNTTAGYAAVYGT
jgi:hypothetical protein